MPTTYVSYQISTIGLSGSLVSGPTGTYGATTLTPPANGATCTSVAYAGVQGNGPSTQLSTVSVWQLP